MKTYKGFNKDLKCRDFQYEIGKEYEEAEAIQCKKGFHACEYPLDVFDYYPPADSRYCEVEQGGEISKGDGDTKVASTKIKIGAEIGIKGIIKAAFEYTKERCTNSERGGNWSAVTGGDKSAVTGGNWSAVTGGYMSAVTGGDCSAVTGGYMSAVTGGDCSAVTGGYWSAVTGGDKSAVTGGNWSAVTGGDKSAVTGGDWSAVTGGYMSAVTGGDCSAVTGGYMSAVTGGDKSAVTGGNWSAVTGGDKSIVYGNGKGCKVRGGIGALLILAEYDDDYNFIKNHIRSVDGDKIKADTYYTLKNGRFVKAEGEGE